MENKIIEFLSSIGFYPLSEDNWIVFRINHRVAKSKQEEEMTLNLIKNKVGRKNGIYVYKNADGKILYIGKGKPIFNRLKAHYYESYGKPEYLWHHFTAFFSSNQGEVEIFCKELEDEDYRVIIETMMQKIYKPEFLGKKSNFKISSEHSNKVTDTNEVSK